MIYTKAEVPKKIPGQTNVKNGGQTIAWMPKGIDPKPVIVDGKGAINGLTPEQEAAVELYQANGAAMVANTKPCDPVDVQHVADTVRSLKKLPTGQKLLTFPSTKAAKEYIEKKTGSLPAPPDSRGSYEGYWCNFLLFSARELNLYSSPEEYRELLALEYSAWNTGALYLYDTCTIAVERPRVLKFDTRQPTKIPYILHCEDGMAIQYEDGHGGYFWHGLQVPERIILRPESITAEEIADEANAEIRRVLMERYGFQRYLQQTGARPVSEDKFGTLYKMGSGRDEYGMVHVVNGSPEPDGSFREFFLHTAAGFRTALDAVASTYGVPAALYAKIAARS